MVKSCCRVDCSSEKVNAVWAGPFSCAESPRAKQNVEIRIKADSA